MNRILISYDLVSPGRNYDDLYDYLTSFPKWARPLESVWVVKTKKSYSQVKTEIVNNYLDSNDKLLVVDITGSASSWHNIPDKDWIKNNG